MSQAAKDRNYELYETIVVNVARIVFLAVFFMLWEYVAQNRIIDPLFIGVPSKIALFLWKGLFVEFTLIKDMLWTMWSTFLAFSIGSIAGIVTGLIFITWPAFERFSDPLFSALNALPRIALAPLFLLWFGLGIWSKVALGASLTYFIVLSSAVAGIRSTNTDHLTLSRTLGASQGQIFTKVTLPSAVPTIFSGLRLGLIYALLGVIGGEIIAAQRGLGQLLSFLAGSFQISGVFAVLFILAILGTGLIGAMNMVEKRLLRWQ
ncbi:ABC transporter permease [Pseudohoeflea coraliihabitans]|uniref:ABC transporter permease n=1 Tax=Pseudohoeflea coraliihabitans TaxID=2860393 RepID=A0ABS6WKG2_9HYPH|nr:ABC transporter permease [Pseudohoeflea sp. DP4N28-3]MBW3096436.1 ABC transporter permease [Pseudohoeflea sp. DP4N28-3]